MIYIQYLTSSICICHVYIYIYIYIYVCVYIHIYTSIYIYVCVYTYTMYIYTHTPLYLMVAMVSERDRGPRRWQLLQLPWARLDLGEPRWGPFVSTSQPGDM
jgi:hypothetical protein